MILLIGCGTANATGTIAVGALADAGSLSGSTTHWALAKPFNYLVRFSRIELGRPMIQV